ncbi:MAG: translation initiation factor Sui1 [Candidatus Altiarchaeales archaeon IMC4]|nr:MAG: translation initiation factor Sui1 [Candidatus Altiarchaeales archaeon IMC4]
MNCPKCGLPQELCVCEEMTRQGQKIRVYSDKRKYGKIVTIVEGFDNVDLNSVAKDLKTRLACGGTAKDGKIELQGSHKRRVKGVLVKMGFSGDMIDVM